MNALAEQLTELSKACWERGKLLPSLALKKLLEKPGEAYHEWNSSLPGYVPPHAEIADSFADADALRDAFERAIAIRERLRAEMIARQEEMDWLVYEAYKLIEKASVLSDESDLSLAREQRPFCLWAEADGDYDRAVALIPSEWSEERKAVWRARLTLIRDNEHVRRIEKPVYKRRWDEQWKVGNTWQCGRPAYDAEFLDAHDWWLSEKAEWWLEKKARGGPVDLEAWTAALWEDTRVQAAWEVAAEAIQRLEAWKREQSENPSGAMPELDAGVAAFAKHFKMLVRDQSVPEGIPWAVPWEKLEKKMKVPAAVKRIRGKLNVPRERFRMTEDGKYCVAVLL